MCCPLPCPANPAPVKPAAAWAQVRVHLVDVNSRQLVHTLLVCTDAQLPPIHRQMEVRADKDGSLQWHLAPGCLS